MKQFNSFSRRRFPLLSITWILICVQYYYNYHDTITCSSQNTTISNLPVSDEIISTSKADSIEIMRDKINTSSLLVIPKTEVLQIEKSELAFSDFLQNGFSDEIPKYFKEYLNDSHYDARFHNASYSQRTVRHENLSNLIKAWIMFSRQHGVTSWLAHGTLLGWFWNQKNPAVGH